MAPEVTGVNLLGTEAVLEYGAAKNMERRL